MTPERIYASGFLCYREPAEACFDGPSLWMLAGPNGSGKSSLFDAMTYALYGLHRGGSTNADELINARSDGLVVEFDFRLDGELYQARRTLRRDGKSTRQIRRRLPDGGANQWEEVAQTSSKKGFEDWVERHIGLTAETFVTSVMLRQGNADCLLNARPKEKHGFLGQIVGLDRYERLYDQANEQARNAKVRTDQLARRLADVPEVTPDALAAAEEDVVATADALQQATARVQEVSILAAHAITWRGLETRRGGLTRRLAELETLLHNRDAIQAQANRLAFLDQHLDGLARFVQASEKQQAAATQLAELDRQEQPLAGRRRACEAISAEQTAAAAQLEAALEETESQRQRLDAQRVALDAALPWLDTLCKQRSALRAAQQTAAEAETQLARLEIDRGNIAAAAPSPAALDDAEQDLRAAETQLNEASCWRTDAHQRWQRFNEVRDAQTCPYCAQNLPHDHVARESERLDEARRQTDRVLHQAQTRCSDARRRFQELRRQAQEAGAALLDLDRQIQAAQHTRATAQDKQREIAAACRDARRQLPEPLRQRAETDGAFPACADVRQSQDEAKSVAAQCTALAAQTTQQRADLSRSCETLERQDRERRSLDQQSQQIERERASLTTDQRHHAAAAEEARAAFPPEWRSWPPAEAVHQLPELRREQRTLRESGIAGQYEKLRQAAQDRDHAAQNLRDLETQIADIPAPARRDPKELEAERRQAEEHREACQQQHRQADKRRDQLRDQQRQRAALLGEYRQADRQRHLWRRLADLLGRGHLQRDLVRSAERRIVEYAGAILDRLSGGTIHIDLRPAADDAAEQAFDLAARTDAAPEWIDVQFLSGSQRFRVAVALSLAIGQYATHHRRPVRSVIIDEGFGCLDAENRQTMIQELHNLKQHLDKIILVTHQDDIAQAFPDGYYCEPNNGTTKLIPFHR
jgi:DNA repair exonuclease SbcCD ATPase subunit